MTSAHGSERERLGAIDLMRFIAALAVVMFHYLYRGPLDGSTSPRFAIEPLHSLSKYGFLGVHLFFMISGFVIAFSAEGRSARDFAASRIARLFPAFWIGIVATTATVHFAEAGAYMLPWGVVALNFTMLNHFVNLPPVDGVYWSLYVELAFYALVWSVLRLGCWRRIEALLAFWLIAAVVWQWWPSWRLDQLLALQYAPFFVAGAVSCRLWMLGSTAMRWGLFVAAWIAALHLMVGWSPSTRIVEPGNITGVTVVLTVFFVAFASLASGHFSRVRGRLVTALGALTYPLYVLHQNIGYILIESLPRTWPAWWTLACVVSLMLGTAYVVSRFIEPVLAMRIRRALSSANRRELATSR